MPAFNSGTPTTIAPISDNYRIAALQSRAPGIDFQIWENRNITYSFVETGSWFNNVYGVSELTAGWRPMNSEQRDAVRKALAAWSNVANITFIEVADTVPTGSANNSTTVGDIRFGFTSAVPAPATGYAYIPSNMPQGGDVWISSTLATQDFTTGTSYSPLAPADQFVQQEAVNYLTLLHEIGHALGLSHPFGSATTRSTAALPAWDDRYSNTVMSYSSDMGAMPTTPMRYDIAAVQYLYGANTSYNAGDNTYSFDIDDINYATIWDGGGVDTLVITNDKNITQQFVAAAYPSVQVDLREGKYISVGFSSEALTQSPVGPSPYQYQAHRGGGRVWLADHVVIENVNTTDLSDSIFGNAANNVIDSGDGADTVDGGNGIDTSVYSRTKSNYTLTVYYDPGKLEWSIPPTTTLAVTDNFTSPNWADSLPTRKTDTLTSIERLQFADVSIAYDLDGRAGTTARIIGAVFGAGTLSNKNYVGIGLDLLDGGMSSQNLMQIALDKKLGAGASNADVVTLLYTNIVGAPPPATAMAYYKGLLDAGSFTQAGLALHAAELSHNAASIDLVGLAKTGIEYI